MRLSSLRSIQSLLVLVALAGAVCACGDRSGAASNPGKSQLTAAPVVGSATLNWSAPSKNQDGTPVGGIAGYYIYYGRNATQLDHVVKVQNPDQNSFEVPDLPAGTYYFSIRAYTLAGISGLASPLVTKTIR